MAVDPVTAPPAPSAPPARTTAWPWLPFLSGNAAAVATAFCAGGVESALRRPGQWLQPLEHAVYAAAEGGLLTVCGQVAAVIALLPFAGPGPAAGALRRTAASVMRAGWILAALVPGLGGMWVVGHVSAEYAAYSAWPARLSALGFGLLVPAVPGVCAAFALAALRGLDRDDLPGGSADAAPPPADFRCGACGYPAVGIDPSGRCPECGRPLPESRRFPPPEQSLSGWRRWTGLRRRLRADPAAFFDKLPMWSGHAASRALLPWSGAAAALVCGGLMALLGLAFAAAELKFSPKISPESLAAKIITVWCAAVGAWGATIAAASASAWLVSLLRWAFTRQPVPLSHAGRVAAYLSGSAATAVGVWWGTSLLAFVGAIGAALLSDVSGFAALGFMVLLMVGLMTVSTLTGVVLGIGLVVRVYRAVTRVRFAAE